MRQKFKTKNTLIFQTSNNKKTKLLEAISKIIHKNPKLIETLWQGLTKDKMNAGSKGLSADQVFRIALLKNIEGLTYDQLVFHLESDPLEKESDLIPVALDNYEYARKAHDLFVSGGVQ